MKAKRKGMVTFFVAKKDGKFAVMNGSVELYRGNDINKASEIFDQKVKEKNKNAKGN